MVQPCGSWDSAMKAWIAPSYPYITYLFVRLVFQLYLTFYLVFQLYVCVYAILLCARALFINLIDVCIYFVK